MLYVILGETCSGKSSIALDASRRLGLPLISSDAFGVYQGFDIGSARSTPEELMGIENYFIGSVPFGRPMTVCDYQREGRKILDDLRNRNKDAVIVGGTFLYVKGLLFPYEFPSEERKTDFSDERPLEEMLAELRRLDPDSLRSIDINNPRRVFRALELARNGNKRGEIVDKYSNMPLYPCVFIRLVNDNDKLRERIRKRVLIQVEQGLFEEEDRLERLNPEFSKTFRGIGFKEIYEGRRTGMPKDEIVEKIIVDTNQYARRQRTFLRHQFPYMVEMEKDGVVSAIEDDIERRDGVESLEFPLIHSSNLLMDTLSDLYSKGVRQCCIEGEFDIGRIHESFPLLQIALYDKEKVDKGRIPRFTTKL